MDTIILILWVIVSLVMQVNVGLTVGAAKSLSIEIVCPGIFNFNFLASLYYNGPALETGLDVIRKSYPSHNWTLHYISRDDVQSCDYLTEEIHDMMSKWYYTRHKQGHVTLFITPGCQSNLIGPYMNQMTDVWNNLLITSWIGEDIKNNPSGNRSSTWLSTTPLPAPSDIYCSFLQYFSWTRVFIAVPADQGGPKTAQYYTFAGPLVALTLRNCEVQVTQNSYRYINGSSRISNIEVILREFHANYRVFLYFGRPDGLREILLRAQEMNLTKGDHVYVAVIPFKSPIFGGSFAWKEGDFNDKVVRDAYRSVILISLIDETGLYESPQIKQLISEWRNLSENVYGNVKMRNELPLPELIATHAAVEMAGLVVNEYAEQMTNISAPPGGRVLAQMLTSHRSLNLQVGLTKMTPFGHGDYKVSVSWFDPETASFKVFLQSSQSDDDSFVWNLVAPTKWFGRSSFPSDRERPCGSEAALFDCLSGSRVSLIVPSVLCSGLILAFIGLIICRQNYQNHLMDGWWRLDNCHLVIYRLKFSSASLAMRSDNTIYHSNTAHFVSSNAIYIAVLSNRGPWL